MEDNELQPPEIEVRLIEPEETKKRFDDQVTSIVNIVLNCRIPGGGIYHDQLTTDLGVSLREFVKPFRETSARWGAFAGELKTGLNESIMILNNATVLLQTIKNERLNGVLPELDIFFGELMEFLAKFGYETEQVPGVKPVQETTDETKQD